MVGKYVEFLKAKMVEGFFKFKVSQYKCLPTKTVMQNILNRIMEVDGT